MDIFPISFPTSSLTGADLVPAAIDPTTRTGAVQGADSTGFAEILTSSVDHVQALHATSDTLGVQAATGDLKDAHDYMIASTQAALATDMVVAVRDRAVGAFNEIMRMPV